MRDGWTKVCGTPVMVVNNRASWALDSRGWSADIHVDGKVVNGQLTVRRLRELLKSGRATIM